ncbi:MAG: hypothetical protein WCF44_08930, partial [Candidatus Methylophosphatis roskildensis]
ASSARLALHPKSTPSHPRIKSDRLLGLLHASISELPSKPQHRPGVVCRSMTTVFYLDDAIELG